MPGLVMAVTEAADIVRNGGTATREVDMSHRRIDPDDVKTEKPGTRGGSDTAAPRPAGEDPRPAQPDPEEIPGGPDPRLVRRPGSVLARWIRRRHREAAWDFG